MRQLRQTAALSYYPYFDNLWPQQCTQQNTDRKYDQSDQQSALDGVHASQSEDSSQYSWPDKLQGQLQDAGQKTPKDLEPLSKQKCNAESPQTATAPSCKIVSSQNAKTKQAGPIHKKLANTKKLERRKLKHFYRICHSLLRKFLIRCGWLKKNTEEKKSCSQCGKEIQACKSDKPCQLCCCDVCNKKLHSDCPYLKSRYTQKIKSQKRSRDYYCLYNTLTNKDFRSQLAAQIEQNREYCVLRLHKYEKQSHPGSLQKAAGESWTGTESGCSPYQRLLNGVKQDLKWILEEKRHGSKPKRNRKRV